VDLFEYGCMINPVEAFFDVGIQNVFGFMADDREHGCDRIVTGPARSEAVAVGGKACFPFGFEHTVGQRLAGAVVDGGDTEGARAHWGPRLGGRGRVWWGYPTASGRWTKVLVSMPDAPVRLCHPGSRFEPASAAARG